MGPDNPAGQKKRRIAGGLFLQKLNRLRYVLPIVHLPGFLVQLPPSQWYLLFVGAERASGTCDRDGLVLFRPIQYVYLGCVLRPRQRIAALAEGVMEDLAGGKANISLVFEKLRKRNGVLIPFGFAKLLAIAEDLGLPGGEAGEKSRSGGVAQRNRRMGLGEVDAFLLQPVHVRGLHCGLYPRLGRQIVDDNQQDVFLPVVLRLNNQQVKQQQDSGKEKPGLHRAFDVWVKNTKTGLSPYIYQQIGIWAYENGPIRRIESGSGIPPDL